MAHVERQAVAVGCFVHYHHSSASAFIATFVRSTRTLGHQSSKASADAVQGVGTTNIPSGVACVVNLGLRTPSIWSEQAAEP